MSLVHAVEDRHHADLLQPCLRGLVFEGMIEDLVQDET
jgi:hypothetical protein